MYRKSRIGTHLIVSRSLAKSVAGVCENHH